MACDVSENRLRHRSGGTNLVGIESKVSLLDDETDLNLVLAKDRFQAKS